MAKSGGSAGFIQRVYWRQWNLSDLLPPLLSGVFDVAHKQDPEEDIFKNSTMTFGEHLEELRRCLFKAVLGLVGGVLIGMFFGGWAVAVIEKPLYDALHAYYTNISLDHANSPLQKKLIEAGFLPDEIYIEPDVLLSQLIHFFPHAFEKATPEVPAPSENADKEEPPASSTAADSKERLAPEEDNLIKLSLWHRAANNPHLQPRSFGAHEPFMIWLKGGLLVGAILATPGFSFSFGPSLRPDSILMRNGM